MESQGWRHLGSLGPIVSTDIGPVEALEAFVGPLDHRFLCRPDPDPGVVELLVWLVCTVGVANLKEGESARGVIEKCAVGEVLAHLAL